MVKKNLHDMLCEMLHQEFLEFYIVLYSPHSPHRAPGKVPHIIVLSSTIHSTMSSTMSSTMGSTMGSTIEYYGMHYRVL